MTAKSQSSAATDPPGGEGPPAAPDRDPTSPGLGPLESARAVDDEAKTTPLPTQPASPSADPALAAPAEPVPAAPPAPTVPPAAAGPPAPSAASETEEQPAPVAATREPPPSPAPAVTGDIEINVFGRTDVGLVREHNEDNFLIADLSTGNRSLLPEVRLHSIGRRGSLFVVCDGMGGAAAGEVASLLAVDTIFERLQGGEDARTGPELARTMVDAVEEAGRRIFSAARLDRTRRGMGTTVTAASVVDGTLYLAQVGDSRAYVVRGTQIEQVTRDQSLLNQLIEAGQLTEEEAEAFEYSNIILQALGTAAEVSVDVTHVPLRRGDVVLLCSDGLSGAVSSERMKEVVLENQEPLEACKKLTDLANAAGGHDNITVIVAHFGGEGLPPPGPDDRLVFERISLPPPPAGSGPPGARPAGSDPPPTYRPTAPDMEAAPAEDDEPDLAPRRGGLTALLLLVALLLGAAIAYALFSGVLTGRAAPATPLPPPSVVSERPPVALQSRSLAPVQIRTSVPNARLAVDGIDRGAFEAGSLKLSLPVGAHDLAVVAAGAPVVSSRLTVVTSSDNEVTLDPPPPPPTAAAPAPLAPVSPVPTTAGEPPAGPRPLARPSRPIKAAPAPAPAVSPAPPVATPAPAPVRTPEQP